MNIANNKRKRIMNFIILLVFLLNTQDIAAYSPQTTVIKSKTFLTVSASSSSSYLPTTFSSSSHEHNESLKPNPPPAPTFHKSDPLFTSTYTQILSTNTLQPVALKLRKTYDRHFHDPREPNSKRFAWDPWYVSGGEGIRHSDNDNNDNDDGNISITEDVAVTPSSLETAANEYNTLLAEEEMNDNKPPSVDGEKTATSKQIQYSLKRIQTSLFFTESDYEDLIQNLVDIGRSIGFTAITPPWTSMYTNGDCQNWHTDTNNGPMAFVLSLCREGDFDGGETIMLRNEMVMDFWRGFNSNQALECGDVVRYIPPTPLGRCIAFDPRIPHGVNTVSNRSSNDPRTARVVIHGWFNEPEVCWFGPWEERESTDEEDDDAMQDAKQRLENKLEPLVELLGSSEEIGRVIGYLAVRLDVSDEGEVCDVVAVCDTLQADRDDFKGIIGYDEEDRPVMEDSTADVRLNIYETLKDLTFRQCRQCSGGDEGGSSSKNRAIVVPFLFE